MKSPEKSRPPLLEARALHLSRGRGGERREVLKGTSFHLRAGETVLLEGPSGCGKSTLLWALARMIPPDRGEVLLEGRPAESWSPMAWRTRVALLLQTHHMIPGTVKENLLLPWTLKVRRSAAEKGGAGSKPDAKRFRAELDRVGLADVDLHGEAGKLSVGQTARLSFVRTLLTAPALMLLDEPFAALDPEAADRVQDRIRDFARAGGGVLLAAHDRADLGATCVLRFEAGRLEEASR